MNIYPDGFASYTSIDKLRVRTLYLIVAMVVLKSQVNLAMRVADHGLSFSIVLSYCIHIFLIINLLIIKFTGIIQWPSLFLNLLITVALGVSGIYAGPFVSPGYYWFPAICFLTFLLVHKRIAWVIPIAMTFIYLNFLFPVLQVHSNNFPLDILNRTNATNSIIVVVFAFFTLKQISFHPSKNKVLGVLSVSYVWVLHIYHWLITGISGPFIIVVLVLTQLFFPKFLKIQTGLVSIFILLELSFFQELVPHFTQNKIPVFLLNTTAVWIISIAAWYLISHQKPKMLDS